VVKQAFISAVVLLMLTSPSLYANDEGANASGESIIDQVDTSGGLPGATYQKGSTDSGDTTVGGANTDSANSSGDTGSSVSMIDDNGMGQAKSSSSQTGSTAPQIDIMPKDDGGYVVDTRYPEGTDVRVTHYADGSIERRIMDSDGRWRRMKHDADGKKIEDETIFEGFESSGNYDYDNENVGRFFGDIFGDLDTTPFDSTSVGFEGGQTDSQPHHQENR